MSIKLNKYQIERFSRQIVLKDIGVLGQKKIIKAKNNLVGVNTHLANKIVKHGLSNNLISELKDYDEIILIGSGKGVTSVSKIDELSWKRRKTNYYDKLNKIYSSLS